MKCIIQIPCLNEETTLPVTLNDLPKSLPGIDEIEILIVDDGSTDRTVAVARAWGVHHVVGFRRNRGLARAFQLGIDTCLARGADVIVNTDADNQYYGPDIARLVAPIVAGEADLVVGDRQTQSIEHFSALKKCLQKHGSLLVGSIAGMHVPDATSGFRAMTREAALELNVISDFSYTLETLIQAGRKKLAVVSVPIRTNRVLRKSRLFRSVFSFVKRSAATMIRVYTTHEPLKVFSVAAVVLMIGALIPFGRFLYFYLQSGAAGHVQSLILGAVLFIASAFLFTVGVLSDLINANRKLLEQLLRKQRDVRGPGVPPEAGGDL
jgi:glycosyltransferase involved in cell wall biosynthesis